MEEWFLNVQNGLFLRWSNKYEDQFRDLLELLNINLDSYQKSLKLRTFAVLFMSFNLFQICNRRSSKWQKQNENTKRTAWVSFRQGSLWIKKSKDKNKIDASEKKNLPVSLDDLTTKNYNDFMNHVWGDFLKINLGVFKHKSLIKNHSILYLDSLDFLDYRYFPFSKKFHNRTIFFFNFSLHKTFKFIQRQINQRHHQRCPADEFHWFINTELWRKFERKSIKLSISKSWRMTFSMFHVVT